MKPKANYFHSRALYQSKDTDQSDYSGSWSRGAFAALHLVHGAHSPSRPLSSSLSLQAYVLTRQSVPVWRPWRCHWPPRPTPSIPHEDGVNRKSIGLRHWHVAAAGSSREMEFLNGLTAPQTWSWFWSYLSFNDSKWNASAGTNRRGFYIVCVMVGWLMRRWTVKWKNQLKFCMWYPH